MHQGNKDWLDHLKKTYPESFQGSVLELGSFDVNGSIRPWFKGAKRYIGVDIAKGKGVDLVCDAKDTKFQPGEFDTLASFSMFEHCDHWAEAFAHNLPWLKEGGMIFLCWGAEGNKHHEPEPWAIVPVQKFMDIAKAWPVEIIDGFFEPTRFTPDCPGAYDVVARKVTRKPDSCIYRHGGVAFRTLVVEDLPTVQKLRNDPSTWIYLSDPMPVGSADQMAWFNSIGWKNNRMYFALCDDRHPFIGLVRMDERDEQNRSLRVGLDVVPEFRRRGYGKKAYEALKAWAFDELHIHRLWLLVLETNTAARALYEKSGFVAEGAFREAIFREGQYLNYIPMSCLEGDHRREVHDPALQGTHPCEHPGASGKDAP